MRRPRSADVARVGIGLGALLRPEAFLYLSRPAVREGARPVVRVLGVRYLAQSGAGNVLARRWVPAADAAVDLVHAVSMLVLAAKVPAHRRLALLSATAATIFAAADLREQNR